MKKAKLSFEDLHYNDKIDGFILLILNV